MLQAIDLPLRTRRHFETHAANMPTVSVIIPCYNAAQTIGRALMSVGHQTLAPLEIIVVDDASQDNSLEVVEQMRAELAPIRLSIIRSPENLGAACARNTGWDNAQGDLIAFLDADDSWHPQKLELQTAWLAANPSVPLCGHGYEVVETHPAHSQESTDAPTYEPIQYYGFDDFLIRNRLSTPTAMLKRSLPQRFSVNKRYSEDYDLWLRISHGHGPCAWSASKLTYLYKKAWGVSGLSGDLGQMYHAELVCYQDCYLSGWISRPKHLSLALLATLKHARRLIKKSIGLAGT